MADISKRAGTLGTENAFVVLAEVNELIRQGRPVISFCIGQPDFNTPANVCEAGIRAIREGKTGYTGSAGIPELREAIARSLTQSRGVDIRPEDGDDDRRVIVGEILTGAGGIQLRDEFGDRPP